MAHSTVTVTVDAIGVRGVSEALFSAAELLTTVDDASEVPVEVEIAADRLRAALVDLASELDSE